MRFPLEVVDEVRRVVQLQRAKGDTRPCIEIIKKYAGNLPIIGVGSIRTAENAAQALQAGVSLIALGRELIMDPEWLKKIAQGRKDDIKTKLAKTDACPRMVPGRNGSMS